MPTIRVNDVRTSLVSQATEAQIEALFGTRTNNNTRTKTSEPLRATMWTVPSADGGPQYAYTFPFTPQQVQYSNLGPEISEITRPGRTPIVAFNRYKARQIALRFLIAAPLDGLFASVDNSIQELQRMIQTARPVYFTNLDKQITNSLTSESTQVFWTITDFSLSSTRRNNDNQITSAEGNLTLVENTNPSIKTADLPRISYTNQAPTNSPRSSSSNRAVDFNAPTWTQTLVTTVPTT